jgi:hypothetical protein
MPLTYDKERIISGEEDPSMNEFYLKKIHYRKDISLFYKKLNMLYGLVPFMQSDLHILTYIFHLWDFELSG